MIFRSSTAFLGATTMRWNGQHYESATKETLAVEDIPPTLYPFEPNNGRLQNDRSRQPTVDRLPFFPAAHRYRQSPPRSLPTTLNEWEHVLHSGPKWSLDLVKHFVCSHPLSNLQSAIKSATSLKCASDGGAEDESRVGSFGVVITLDPTPVRIRGGGHVDGPHPSSFRAEATGMLSGMCMLSILEASANLRPDMPKEFVSDNDGLVTDITRLMSYGKPHVDRNANKADLMTAMVRLHHVRRHSSKWTWVRSHQDNRKT